MNLFQKKILISSAVLILLISCIAATLIFIKKKQPHEYAAATNNHKPHIEKVIIQPGDILALTLSNSRLSLKDSSDIIGELRKVVNVNYCLPGDFYEIRYNSRTGKWTDFRYYPSGILYYSLTKSANNIIKTEKKKLTTITKRYKSQGIISSSLWGAMSSHKIPWKIIASFADIFAGQIDFLTDTKEGDTFKVVYDIENIVKKNEELSSRIIAAEYRTSSKTYKAFYFKTKNSGSGYFDETGKSLKSAFLKAPLQFRTISSHFTTRRFHPILKYTRPHLGIDYAAPSGTPVSSVGDGVVAKARYSGGFGNLVIIKHSNGYETHYGHLSKYGRRIRRGVRVKQGQIIGYVGMTGLATGPHLDFRIKSGGKFLNFLKMKQPSAKTLTNEDKKVFEEKIQVFLNEYENQ